MTYPNLTLDNINRSQKVRNHNDYSDSNFTLKLGPSRQKGVNGVHYFREREITACLKSSSSNVKELQSLHV